MRIENVAPADSRTPLDNPLNASIASLKMRFASFLVLTAALFAALLTGCGDGETPDPVEEEPSDESQPLGYDLEPTTEDPKDILEAMVAAYQSADSYVDLGILQLWRAPSEIGTEPELLFSGEHTIFMERPNKIRIAVGDARVVSDGETMIYQTALVPGQIISLPAPEEMKLADIFPEAIVLEAMSMQELLAPLTWAPLQTVLFFAEDPMRTLAPEGVELTNEVPGIATGRNCDRVCVSFPNWGSVIYWVERETRTLLRVELPPTHFAPTEEDANQLALILEPRNAEFNVPLEDNAFQFAGPEGLETVERFSFPAMELLGQKVEGLAFNDLNGEAVGIDDFADGITAIVFWSPQSPIDRVSLQLLDSLRNRYEGRGEVQFLAVNVDDPEQTRDETIQDLLKEWGVEIPLLRDPNGETFASMLGGSQIPSIVIFDQEQRFQASLTGSSPAFVTDSCLPALEMIISGENLYEEILSQIELNHTDFLNFRDKCIAEGAYGWFLSNDEEASTDPSVIASEEDEPEETETVDDPIQPLDLPKLFVTEMTYSMPNARTGEDLFLWDQLLPLKDAAFDAVSIRRTDDAFFLAGYAAGEPTEEIEIPRETVVTFEASTDESENDPDQTSDSLGEIPQILCVKPEQDPDGRRNRLVLFQTLTQKASVLNEQLEIVAVHELNSDAGFIDALLMPTSEDEDADLFVSHFAPATGVSKIVRTSLDGEQRWECVLPVGIGPMFLQTVLNVENRPVALYATNGDIGINITIEEGIHTEQFPVIPGTAGRVFNEWLLTQNLPSAIQQGATADLPGSMRILALPQLSHILAVSFDATGHLLWRTPFPDVFTPSGEPCILTVPESNEPCWVQFGNAPEMGFILFDRDGTIFAQGDAPEYDGIRLIGTWDGRPAVYVWRDEDCSVWTLKASEEEETPLEEAASAEETTSGE
jgi:hypothetical protein